MAFTPFSLRPKFGRLARPDREPLAALNTMLAEDGATLEVADGVDAGLIDLISIGTESAGRATAFHPRHAIRLGKGAKMVLMETALGKGTYLHNPVTAIEVAEDAALSHVRLQDEATSAFHLATLYVDVAGRRQLRRLHLQPGCAAVPHGDPRPAVWARAASCI